MPTTPPCPLPTKIPLEPKTQIKELKKKKKKPSDHCHIQPIWTQKIKINPCLIAKHTQNPHKTQISESTKPRSTKPFDSRRHQINAANITPHLAHHQWSWATHHWWHWQLTNLHRSEPTPPPNPWFTDTSIHRSLCCDHKPNPALVQALKEKERCEMRERVRKESITNPSESIAKLIWDFFFDGNKLIWDKEEGSAEIVWVSGLKRREQKEVERNWREKVKWNEREEREEASNK